MSRAARPARRAAPAPAAALLAALLAAPAAAQTLAPCDLVAGILGEAEAAAAEIRARGPEASFLLLVPLAVNADDAARGMATERWPHEAAVMLREMAALARAAGLEPARRSPATAERLEALGRDLGRLRRRICGG